MSHPLINSDRLWDSLRQMALIGATPKGGVHRLALSEEDRRARELFREWCESLDMSVRHDAMGNQFARFQGRDPEAHPILIGSHLDSQPTGGKYDGTLGVLAGLEVIRTLVEQGIELNHPLELVNWTNEEGARFAPAMIGSGVYAGAFELEDAHAIQDQEGITIKDALDRIGYLGQGMEQPHYIASLELHIEQGPVLEEKGQLTGVVTGVQRVRWYEIRVYGKAAHAGSTPMSMRYDPVKTAMSVIGACYDCIALDDQAKVTFGTFRTYPGAINTVPEQVTFNIDLRHPDGKTLDQLDTQFRELMKQKEKTGITIIVKDIWHSPPVRFHENCIQAVSKASEKLGLPANPMLSGAGHDSVYLNRVIPTGMIFIPCKDGLSHNEAESIESHHATAGTNVLLHALLELDKPSSEPH